MKNIRELRTEMVAVFGRLKRGTIKIATAKEINNTAGKIISSVRTELEYAALRNEKPNIPFLDGPKTRR